MKLSFTIRSSKSSSKSHTKPKPKPKQQQGEDDTTKHNHWITEFDPSKPPTLPTPKTLIPPIQNQWTPLNNNSNNSAPLRRREDKMLQKLKDDLKRLPEDQGFDEFKDVPVEGFGAALLAGYGWSEGMGIGKNAKEDVKVVEYKPKTVKEGLGLGFGFVGDATASRTKEKEEEKREGSVVSTIADGYLVLKLSESGEQVKVKVDDVAELGSKEEERCLRKLKDMKI